MFRPSWLIALLLVLPALAAAPAGSPMGPGPGGPVGSRPLPLRPEPRFAPRESLAAERFQHREARIREALERGDLTPNEANMLRQRLDARRERLERWREQRLRENGRTDTPPANATPAP
ncbi:hypothetical protein [Chitinimonas naiadis]